MTMRNRVTSWNSVAANSKRRQLKPHGWSNVSNNEPETSTDWQAGQIFAEQNEPPFRRRQESRRESHHGQNRIELTKNWARKNTENTIEPVAVNGFTASGKCDVGAEKKYRARE